MHPWDDVMKVAVNVCGLPFETHDISFFTRKTSDESQIRVYYKIPVLFKTMKVIKEKKESLRNCLSQEESKETWNLMVIWYLTGSWNSTKALVKTKIIWIKYKLCFIMYQYCSIIINVPYICKTVIGETGCGLYVNLYTIFSIYL